MLPNNRNARNASTVLLLGLLAVGLAACESGGGYPALPTATLAPESRAVGQLETALAATASAVMEAPTEASAVRPTEAPPATEPTREATEAQSEAPVGGDVSTQTLVAAFKAAGLEAENPRTMTAKDYGAAPMVGAEATIFGIPSVCADCNGRVFTFASTADRDTLRDYYEALGKKSALFFSWVFVEGNTLLQLNGDMEEEMARKYEAALKEAVR